MNGFFLLESCLAISFFFYQVGKGFCSRQRELQEQLKASKSNAVSLKRSMPQACCTPICVCSTNAATKPELYCRQNYLFNSNV